VTVQIAHFYATACLAIAFFQIALIAGVPLGRYTQGGQHEGALPVSGRIVAAVSIPVVLFQALAILSAAGFPGLGWPAWTGWVAFAVQIVTTILNWITPSKPERAVWGPVTLVMSAMALVVLTA
jgi:cytochrome bd-type quinol oxidase subunit 2